jgi:predicted Rossmann fold nucleotide-binding protein DprA/Smf involved in DNA uptake
MRRETLTLIDGKWITANPSKSGQKVRETSYFDDGTFGVVEYVFESSEHVSDMRITGLAFKNRMTSEERKAIRRAAAIDEDVQDFVDLANSATHIDLSLQQTIESVNALEQFGLIAEGRAAEILSPPVTDDERYEG